MTTAISSSRCASAGLVVGSFSSQPFDDVMEEAGPHIVGKMKGHDLPSPVLRRTLQGGESILLRGEPVCQIGAALLLARCHRLLPGL